MPGLPFSSEKRAAFLALYRNGFNQADAARKVDVDPSTITRWAKAGLQEGASVDERLFAEEYEALKFGEGARPLTKRDIIRLLEKAAVERGSVTAMRLLLEKPWERKAEKPSTDDEVTAPILSIVDRLAAKRAGGR